MIARDLGPLHIVSAWASEEGIALGQVATDAKSNEITAIPQLLDQLSLTDTVITIDAMGCQKEIVAQIVDGGGDCVIAVKDNQPTLKAAIEAYFNQHLERDLEDLRYRSHETHDEGHGRIDERSYVLTKTPRDFAPRADWPWVKAIGYTLRLTQHADGTETDEVRYYICTRYLSGKRFAEAVRQHWGIESMHWVLDVNFREDESRTRERTLGNNLSWLRRFAITLLKRHPAKDSLRGKMTSCMISTAFLTEVLMLNEFDMRWPCLDHDPDHTDITAFFGRFQAALTARGLTLKGITTDGSSLYPEPIAAVFGEVPHQLCTFHILREVTKAILTALAQERKRLAATAPQLPRGRPKATKAAQDAARCKKRIQRKVGDLFEHRYLFVQKHLSPSERVTLQRISRGLPQFRQLRELMDEVYRLFDRRCRMATALAKLAALRTRLRRFKKLRTVLKKLMSPGLEKALVFLDERLLGATSNAVERGNRRYRKMQKTVYRVRTKEAIEGRLALDLLRDSQAQGRARTTKTLHKARAA